MLVNLRLVCMLLTTFTLVACNTVYSAASSHLSISSPKVLPSELSETSGLYCEAEFMLSLNDSGNAPVLFAIDFNGEIVKRLPLNVTNLDWEAITADEEHYFIADVGNNHGKREYVEIYKINRRDLTDVNVIRLTYAGNTVTGNSPYAHDFDSEAIVKKDNALLLFSKSWRTGVTQVYTIDEKKSEQVIKPAASIKGLPGVVTGADYDHGRGVFVITGYKSDPFGNFSAFLAQVSPDFSVKNLWPLEAYKQVEGVCVDDKGRYWFSEEAIKARPASLSNATVM